MAFARLRDSERSFRMQAFGPFASAVADELCSDRTLRREVAAVQTAGDKEWHVVS